MATVILVAIALVGLILLQKSEGGALGMGGGPGSMMSGRGAANLLTRSTSALGAAFFATSLGLAFIATTERTDPTVLERQLQENQVLELGEDDDDPAFVIPPIPRDGDAPSAPDAQSGESPSPSQP